MTSQPTISIIAAVAHNYAIGVNGDLPWKLPADMKWFREHTLGKPVIFGRRTFESMGALKDRTNIVVTSRESLDDDVFVSETLEDALELAEQHVDDNTGEIMILGGAMIYEEAILIADRFYLTVVHTDLEDADTFFPPIDDGQWRVSFHKTYAPDKKNKLAHSYLILERFQYGPSEQPSAEHLPGRFRPVTDNVS